MTPSCTGAFRHTELYSNMRYAKDSDVDDALVCMLVQDMMSED